MKKYILEDGGIYVIIGLIFSVSFGFVGTIMGSSGLRTVALIILLLFTAIACFRTFSILYNSKERLILIGIHIAVALIGYYAFFLLLVAVIVAAILMYIGIIHLPDEVTNINKNYDYTKDNIDGNNEASSTQDKVWDDQGNVFIVVSRSENSLRIEETYGSHELLSVRKYDNGRYIDDSTGRYFHQ